MADVQLEKGHVRIANPVIEAIALAPFNGGQARVFLAVIRATWGWQRKDAELSTGDLAQATGLARSTAAAALRDLVDEGVVVEVRPPSFRGAGVYRPQKDPTRWGKFAVLPPALSEDSETPESRRLRNQEPETPEFRTGDSGIPETPAPEPVAPVGETPPRKTVKDRKDRELPSSDADAASGKPPRKRGTAAAAAAPGEDVDLMAVIVETLDEIDALPTPELRRPFLTAARKITSGLDLEVWKDPKGGPAPTEERPRLLKLAVLHWDAQEGHRMPLRSCLRYVVAQQLDPFPTPPAADSRGPSASEERAHYAGHRAAAAKRGAADPTPDEASRIAAWKTAHPAEAAALWEEVKAWGEDDPEYRKLLIVSRDAAEKWLRQRHRGLILEAMEQPTEAAS